MGGHPRPRTAEEQEIHDKILPLLMAGASSRELSNQYGISPNTLRVWRFAEKRKGFKRSLQALQTVADEVRNTKESAQNTTTTPPNSPKSSEVDPTGVLKHSLQGRTFDLMPFFSETEGNVAPILLKIHKLISDTIDNMSQTPAELAYRLPQAIKQVIQAVADLHCLPLGQQKVNAFSAIGSTGARSQHLHLHSHGGGGPKGSKSKAIDAPKAVIDVARTTPQQELLSRLLTGEDD